MRLFAPEKLEEFELLEYYTQFKPGYLYVDAEDQHDMLIEIIDNNVYKKEMSFRVIQHYNPSKVDMNKIYQSSYENMEDPSGLYEIGKTKDCPEYLL